MDGARSLHESSGLSAAQQIFVPQLRVWGSVSMLQLSAKKETRERENAL